MAWGRMEWDGDCEECAVLKRRRGDGEGILYWAVVMVVVVWW